MCLAIPAKVVELHAGEHATVTIDGVHNRISTALLDQVAVGDYVIVHVGFAISRLDVDEAERTLATLAELADAEERSRALGD